MVDSLSLESHLNFFLAKMVSTTESKYVYCTVPVPAGGNVALSEHGSLKDSSMDGFLGVAS
jgi:hypothetical protein